MTQRGTEVAEGPAGARRGAVGVDVGATLAKLALRRATGEVEFALDLVDKDGARPTVFGGLGGIPEAEFRVFEFLKKLDVVSPRDAQ